MKDYTLFRMKCNCSLRMKTRGKLIKIYENVPERKCPNCSKVYKVKIK